MSWLGKCGKMAPVMCALILGGNAQCATVTASKDYVDKRTSMSPVYEDGNTNAVVGYRIGVHTNSVLASRESVSNITSSTAGMVASSTNGLACLLTNGTIVAAKAGGLRDGSENVRTAETIFSQIDTSFLEITNSAIESEAKYRQRTDLNVYTGEISPWHVNVIDTGSDATDSYTMSWNGSLRAWTYGPRPNDTIMTILGWKDGIWRHRIVNIDGAATNLIHESVCTNGMHALRLEFASWFYVGDTYIGILDRPSEYVISGTLATMAEVGLRTTTNDVCNIVTNKAGAMLAPKQWEDYEWAPDVGWIMENGDTNKAYYCLGQIKFEDGRWEANYDERSWNDMFDNWDGDGWIVYGEGGEDAEEVTFVVDSGTHREITVRRESIGLGVARMSDLEAATNRVMDSIGPVRVGADTNVEKDVSVRIGFGAYSSSMEQNQSPHNGWKRGIAIGQYAIASAAGVSIGPFAGMSSGSTSGSISIGLNSTAANQDAIAIGNGAGWTGVDDTSNMGKFSVAIGLDAGSEGDDSSALGSKAYAFGGGSVAVGNRAKAGTVSISIGRDSSTINCDSAIAIGQKATTSAQRSIAIGHNSRAAINGLAIGSHTQSDNTEAGGSSIAIGAGAKSCTVSGDSGISIGYLAKTPNGGTAIGANAVANSSTIAIGTWSAAAGSWATANGYKATARVNGATSVGAWADASGLGSIAIGGGRGGWGDSPSQSPAAAAKATESIQLGVGTNSVANTFQVWSHRMLDKSTGKIPAERIPDSIFSTNNAAFVAAVTNCPVTVPGTDASEIGAGTYGTIGAIIAALVAAVATLKRQQRYSIVSPTVSVSSGAASVELQDRAINTVSLGSDVTQCTFTFPQKDVGMARDFFMRLTITGSAVPTLYFREPGGASVAFDVDDDSWAEIEQGVNVLMFSDTSEGSVA